MRCRICDAGLSEVHFNADHNDYEPCVTCLAVIEDTLAGFIDRPSVEDDELGKDDTVSFYSSTADDPSPND